MYALCRYVPDFAKIVLYITEYMGGGHTNKISLCYYQLVVFVESQVDGWIDR